MNAGQVRYHIQETGSGLRDGFPYFTHHDSISALWAQKWRPPCAAGLYPFGDGKVEDFDPVFAKLVEISADDASWLRRPDDYARPFLPVSQDLAGRGEQALADGRTDEARDLFLRAAAVWRIARFPVNRSPLGQEAWECGKAAYEKGAALFDSPNMAVRLPFTRADPAAGDQKGPIKAYLRVPAGVRPEAGWPLLLFICGLDAYRTDNTQRIQTHVDRGFATLSFEIPGTGDCPAAPNDPTSPDRLMNSVLDWVEANAVRLSLDPKKVAARGISTGGYYAFRLAHTHADRLVAVAEQGGGCHHMFDPAWIDAQNQMEYPFALADALAWKFGYRDPDPEVAVRNYMADAKKFSLLDSGLLDAPSCRLLVLNGMEDTIFPIEDSLIVATRGKNKDLVARGNLSHMGNPGGEQIVYEWLDRALTG